MCAPVVSCKCFFLALAYPAWTKAIVWIALPCPARQDAPNGLIAAGGGKWHEGDYCS